MLRISQASGAKKDSGGLFCVVVSRLDVCTFTNIPDHCESSRALKLQSEDLPMIRRSCINDFRPIPFYVWLEKFRDRDILLVHVTDHYPVCSMRHSLLSPHFTHYILRRTDFELPERTPPSRDNLGLLPTYYTVYNTDSRKSSLEPDCEQTNKNGPTARVMR